MDSFGVELFGLPSLGALLKEPYCALPASSRAVFTADGSCTLLGDGPVSFRPEIHTGVDRSEREVRLGV